MPGKKSKPVQIKTKQTGASVDDFIEKAPDEQQRKDSYTILEMMKKSTVEEPRMWGASLIGFGIKTYKSPRTGREVEWFHIGFSPRKANLSIHLVLDLKQYETQLQKLGKFKTGAGCIYINKLADVDLKVLKKLVDAASKKS